MNLYFKELGQGPPLIMLHGLFGSSDNWLGVAPKLAQHFHVFLVDLRNHGLSPHSDDMTLDIMAGDLAEFLDARQVDRVHILGHSLGGKVANVKFALTEPAPRGPAYYCGYCPAHLRARACAHLPGPSCP